MMHTRRLRVIATGVLLAVVGAVAPLAAMAYASWQIAIGKELDELQHAGRMAISRAEYTFAEVRQTIVDLESANVSPCSPAHISLMRISTVNADSVSEIGYSENGVLKCTSWGNVTGTDIHTRYFDYKTADGMEVTLRVQPSVSLGKKMTSIRIGSQSVLVAPSRFTDIGLSQDLSLALVSSTGQLISSRHDADVFFAQRHVNREPSGIDGDKMFATVAGNGMFAVVTEPTSMVYDRLRGEMVLLLPAGLFIAIFIVALVMLLSRRRLSPRAELEIAVQNREFVVHYQPIIELETHICVGAEALVRWKRPDGSLVRPDLFIPLAEETGLISQITDQVCDAIIRDLGHLLVEDRGLHVAINLSAEDIRTGRFLDMLDAKLKGTRIRSEQILLEATERGFIDIEAARETLARARAAGHTVAIDDFGTGYSSLQYLQGLPMDTLKIDKSFVETIGKGTATSSVTQHIIAMAKELGLRLVAEGVETEEQAAYLRRHGVDMAQGWLFSKPVEADDFIAFQQNSKLQFGPAPETVRSAA